MPERKKSHSRVKHGMAAHEAAAKRLKKITYRAKQIRRAGESWQHAVARAAKELHH